MTREIRAGAVAICATPHLLIAVLLMFGLWGGAAEIYSVLVATSGRGEFVALALAIYIVPVSGLLFANFLKLAHDLRELRVPRRRQLLAGALSFILGVMWVIPWALLALGHWSARDLFIVALGVPAGLLAALLWRMLARGQGSLRHTTGAETRARAAPSSGFPRALRVALGPPYAPAPWPVRVIQLLLVCVVLALPPLLVAVFAGALSAGNFAALMHAAELLGFLAAIGWCWVWPLSRAVVLFDPLRGALTELALLPGLGEGRQRLLRLFRVAIIRPAAGLLALLVIAMGAAWLEHPAHAFYWKLALEFCVIPMGTLPVALGLMARPHALAPWRVPLLMLIQIVPFTVAVWTGAGDMLVFASFRWLILAFVLMLLILVAGVSTSSLRKLLQRPHPFMDVSA